MALFFEPGFRPGIASHFHGLLEVGATESSMIIYNVVDLIHHLLRFRFSDSALGMSL
jgi:hypothetical protein